MLNKLENMYRTLVDLIWNKELYFLHTISYSYFVISILTFCILIFGITAPYGRYLRGGWGINLNAKVAWFVQELPALTIPVMFLILDRDAPRFNVTPNMLLFGLLFIHYIHRVCIFPFLINGGKPMPFAPFFIALTFCTVNGYLQSAYLLYHGDYGTIWWKRLHIWIGTVMFFVGMTINVHSDHVLRNLRKPGETGYKIPKGGMFNYISGANFFGEMVEWAGFAVATWSIPGLAFSFFTCSNLGPRAWHHHKYYIQKFEDYPKNRKAVIPFIL